MKNCLRAHLVISIFQLAITVRGRIRSLCISFTQALRCGGEARVVRRDCGSGG